MWEQEVAFFHFLQYSLEHVMSMLSKQAQWQYIVKLVFLYTFIYIYINFRASKLYVPTFICMYN